MSFSTYRQISLKLSFAEKAFLFALFFLRALTIRALIARLEIGRRVRFTELYHFILILILTATSIYSNFLSMNLITFILIYLVNEFVVWTLFDVLVESKVDALKGRRNAFRAFIWAVYSYVVIAWVFGIYFAASGDIGIMINGDWQVTHSIKDGIYFSGMTITTLGFGDYIIARNAVFTQLLTLLEPLIGILILAFYLAAFLSAISSDFVRPLFEIDYSNDIRTEDNELNQVLELGDQSTNQSYSVSIDLIQKIIGVVISILFLYLLIKQKYKKETLN
ncbi:MAG: ion channel [Anaerolineales bacterium]